MVSFQDHFSFESILRSLCKARAKRAKNRNDFLFLDRIAKKSILKQKAVNLLDEIFPPRRSWHKFRPKERSGKNSFELNVVSLYRAVQCLRTKKPAAPWVQKLEKLIHEIQFAATQDPSFTFRPPKVIAQKKSPKSNEYRPVAAFPLKEKIIDSLSARYIRKLIDPVLLPSCLAFRCAKLDQAPPSIHDALHKLVNVNRRNRKTGLYVAECDIKGFFDCVSHDAAKTAVAALLEAAQKKSGAVVDLRAWFLFEKYLDCYEFATNVDVIATKALQKRDPKGKFKWHQADLQQLHGKSQLSKIGVPQGGALSCVIANAVLHEADVEQARYRRKSKKAVTYMRYCDDMILLSNDQSACREAFDVYTNSLYRAKLPAHPPSSVSGYSKDFWKGKSNAPYHWASNAGKSCVPWIQFVGFQVRHDGFVRIRPKSIQKQRARITKAADQLLQALNPGRKKRGQLTPTNVRLRKNPSQVRFRFQQQILSISVGRRQAWEPLGTLKPMCWANGFRGLKGKKVMHGFLKTLDRHRGRQFQRVLRRLETTPKKSSQKASDLRASAYYGYPYSYFAQFAKH